MDIDSPAPPVAARPSVLLVDSAARRADVVDALTASGLRVVEADDAASAVDVLEREGAAVSLVVTDLDVLPIGGFTLARAIHRRWSAMPVAIVTAQTSRKLAVRALAAGVVLLERPLEADKLVRAVHKLLAGADPALALAVLSETGTSFVPLHA